MRRELRWYYVTRGLIVLAWVALMVLVGARFEIILLGVLAMGAFYLWLPHSGRYLIRTDKPLAPLQRDERERMIAWQAGSYAFAVLTALLTAAVLGAGLRRQGTLSVDLISVILGVGMTIWFAAAFWLRRKM